MGLPILISTGSHFSYLRKLQKAITSGIVVSQFSSNEIRTLLGLDFCRRQSFRRGLVALDEQRPDLL